MLSLRARRSLGLLVPLLGWAAAFLAPSAPAAAQGAVGHTVDARQLLAIARGGLTAAAGAAQGPLAPGAAKNHPFWAAVDAMGHALDTVEAALLARDPAFFADLGAGSRTLAELRAVWAHAGPAGPAGSAITSGLETLSSAYSLLRGSYGWEALRRQQGGALSAEEARRQKALARAQAALAGRLATVRAQAARAGDRRAAADLDRLIAQARSLAAAQLTLDSYLAAQSSAEALQGEWAGDSRYVKPAVRKAWRRAAPLVEDLTTDSAVGFVFTTDLSQADSWAPLETPVEVPAGVDLGDLGSEGAATPALEVAAEERFEDAQPFPAPEIAGALEDEEREAAEADPPAPPQDQGKNPDKGPEEEKKEPVPAPAPTAPAVPPGPPPQPRAPPPQPQ
jgi:hypothetical protein